MRVIKDIIIHSSETKPKVDIGIMELKLQHTSPPPLGLGYKDVCYHYIIRLDGTIERGRPTSRAGAHCFGHNAHSIGICYIGGLDASGEPADTRTLAQKLSMKQLVCNLVRMYRCDIHGLHDYYKSKNNPAFDAHEEYSPIYQKIVGIR